MAVFGKARSAGRRYIPELRPGFGIIEVMIALSMATVIIVSVGNTLAANDRLSTTSLAKGQALNYARQGIEIIQQIKDQEFGCTVVSPATACNNGSLDSCTALPGYSSCWSEFPVKSGGGHWSNGPLKLVARGGTWQLQDGTETIGVFTRKIHLTNSDPSCPPAAVPNHCNIKTLTVEVGWTDHGQPKNTALTTLITGWKNLP